MTGAAGSAGAGSAAGTAGVADLGRPQPVAAGALAASPEVVAAIAAAVEECWPRRSAAGGVAAGLHRRAPGAPEYVWRMSGRWWSKPVSLRRDRPWSDHSDE